MLRALVLIGTLATGGGTGSGGGTIFQLNGTGAPRALGSIDQHPDQS